MSLQHYIVIYDSKQRKLLDLERFGEEREAAARRLSELEDEHLGNSSLQIVLLASDSLNQLRVTHPHYFKDLDVAVAA